MVLDSRVIDKMIQQSRKYSEKLVNYRWTFGSHRHLSRRGSDRSSGWSIIADGFIVVRRLTSFIVLVLVDFPPGITWNFVYPISYEQLMPGRETVSRRVIISWTDYSPRAESYWVILSNKDSSRKLIGFRGIVIGRLLFFFLASHCFIHVNLFLYLLSSFLLSLSLFLYRASQNSFAHSFKFKPFSLFIIQKRLFICLEMSSDVRLDSFIVNWANF